ncbi:MAG: hypothetical protein KDA48_05320, partial [Amphiplicatus sp.]|nr:hypothetical protein [Amphiplicatus sp.]
GAMIETPAAVWRMEEIASRVDFLSVGGNDLAQFYFAADRESELTQRRYDPIDPGFLSFLGLIVQKASASGTPLSYCGEQAADLLMAAALIGLGVRRFSIPATSVGPFRRMVRSIEAGAVSSWFETRVTRGGEGMRADLIAHLRQGGVELSPQK